MRPPLPAPLTYAYPGKVSATQADQKCRRGHGVVAERRYALNTDPTDGYQPGLGYVEVDISQPIRRSSRV